MTTSSNSSNPPQAQTSGMWGGRFSEATDAFVAEFTASVQFDQRFYKQDIAGSIAHATMLAKVGVLTEQERDDIITVDAAVVVEIGVAAVHVPDTRLEARPFAVDREPRCT